MTKIPFKPRFVSVAGFCGTTRPFPAPKFSISVDSMPRVVSLMREDLLRALPACRHFDPVAQRYRMHGNSIKNAGGCLLLRVTSPDGDHTRTYPWCDGTAKRLYLYLRFLSSFRFLVLFLPFFFSNQVVRCVGSPIGKDSAFDIRFAP